MTDEPDYPRSNAMQPMATIVAPHLRVVRPDDFSTWTEEQWAERDREVAEWKAKQEAAERHADERAFREKLRAAGWPTLALEEVDGADYAAPAIEALRSWTSRERNMLILSGSPGCGKTVASAWWALQRNSVTHFVRATTLAASSRYDRDARREILGAFALALDDLGAEYLDEKGSFRTDLDELIDVFYGDRKPLVITTNLDKHRFAQRYGERFIDRIRECGRWVGLTNPSLRPRKR